MTTVSLCTWNAGNGNKQDLGSLMLRFDAIAGQEWGDRADLTRYAKENHWQVILGDDDGSASTPLLVAPNVKIRRKVSLVMLPNMDLGQGAGPSRTKQKCAVGALIQVDRTILGVVSTHLVASQQFARREAAAREHIRSLVRTFDKRHFPWFILGDFNCTPDKHQLDALYKAGWTNTAMKDRPLPTHGNRCIDYVWWERSRSVGYLRQKTYPTRSDHHALGAAFRVS